MPVHICIRTIAWLKHANDGVLVYDVSTPLVDEMKGGVVGGWVSLTVAFQKNTLVRQRCDIAGDIPVYYAQYTRAQIISTTSNRKMHHAWKSGEAWGSATTVSTNRLRLEVKEVVWKLELGHCMGTHRPVFPLKATSSCPRSSWSTNSTCGRGAGNGGAVGAVGSCGWDVLASSVGGDGALLSKVSDMTGTQML
jgi:hypothetical protein